MIRHTLLALSLGFILFFLYLFQYTGFFKSVTVSEDRRGPYTIVFKSHVGAYHHVVDKIEEVEKWAQANGLKCRLSFGQYFDDPRLVEEGRLRSRGGCLADPLVKEEAEKLESLKSQLPQDFVVDIIPQSRSVVALFMGAPSVGPMRVYPAAEEYIKKNNLKLNGAIVEIYEVFNKNTMQTTYIWPVQD